MLVKIRKEDIFIYMVKLDQFIYIYIYTII